MSFFSLGGSGRESWRDHMFGQRPAFWIFVIIVISIVLYSLSRIPVKTTEYYQKTREIVWASCQTYIAEQYGFEADLAEDYAQTRITLLPDDGYVANISYADGVDFRCTMQQMPDDSWQLVSLEMH